MRENLYELHTELEKLKAKDPDLHKRLEGLTEEITAMVENRSDADGSTEALRSNIQKTAEQFESEHPTVTAVLDRFVTLLSNMGI